MMSCSPELTVYDFFHSYIFSRAEACMHLSEQDQRIVKIAKNTLSIITFGILPNFCKRWWGGDSGNYTIQVANLARRLKDCDYFNLPTFKEDATQIKESKNKDCDRILNGLFLGSSKSFVEATTLNFKVLENCFLVPKTFTNIYKFTSVITMCPMEAILGDYTELPKGQLAANFSTRKVTWLHPGKDLGDDEQAGFDLAYNATNLTSPLILETVVGHTRETLETLSDQKRQIMNKLDVHEWFKTPFAEMDKAILGHGNTLVHCQAGISRSATLVAAYLINRFDLSVDTAINYLKNKRACVNPKFATFLHDYANRLKNPSEPLKSE